MDEYTDDLVREDDDLGPWRGTIVVVSLLLAGMAALVWFCAVT